MADLKAGTTIGGTLVWTQGNFPLFPTGNTLLYKTFKIYSENDKPQAVDNDFVSKALGGTFVGLVEFNAGLRVGNNASNSTLTGTLVKGNADGALYSSHNIALTSPKGIGFGTAAGNAALVMDVTTGAFSTIGQITAVSYRATGAQVNSNDALTRKDYVDTLINNITIDANDKVPLAGGTMTGTLTAPNFISSNLATLANHVPQLGQVIQRGVSLDYGTF